ncbi:hypothetical protein [Nitrosopumilus sp.]|uniref:hypothetical protein n=1 Tax=Nitrosopumilus sp. TaxID=2024843 RepID=UPI003B5BEF7B
MEFSKALEIWKSQKNLILALIVIGILFYPIGFVHEAGHYLVGNLVGSTCEFGINWTLSITCKPVPEPSQLYFVMGGVFGMLIGLSLVSNSIRRNKPIFIGICAITLDHFLKAIFETFAHSLYLNNFMLNLAMGTLPILLTVMLAGYYTRLDKNKS